MSQDFRQRWIYSFPISLIQYILVGILMLGATGLLFAVRLMIDDSTVALLYLLPVGICSALWGLGPGILAAVSAFLAFNFFFITPYYSLMVHKSQDLITLVIFLGVAVVINQMMGRTRRSLVEATARERDAVHLFRFITLLAGLQTDREIIRAIVHNLTEIFLPDHIQIVVEEQSEGGSMIYSLPERSYPPQLPNGKSADPDLLLPLQTTRSFLGEVRFWRRELPLTAPEERLMKTLVSQGLLALERARYAQADTRAKILGESDRLKTALLSSVSHELRTPLATIKAAVTSLRSGAVDWDHEARGELLAVLEEETDHLNQLVGNLLNMSRIEAGALHLQKQWNVLSEILAGVLRRITNRDAAMGGHVFQVAIPEELPLVPVDYTLIEQVFANLLSNSIKYSPSHTTIQISAAVQADQTVLVRVTNQGPPVPNENLERIFDKFYRINKNEAVSGTGLGLSICKGIIEAHGGRIWGENLKAGFAFNFTLPLTWADEGPHLPLEEADDKTQAHILVIDDEPQILRALRTILTARQFQVTVASRGEEGLALAAAQAPDLIILDLSLPDMDGFEVCAQLREWTQIPIIVLSVRESERDKVMALDKGADDYLTKPFGIEELLARIRVALRHFSQSQSPKGTLVKAGPIEIDLVQHLVTRDKVEVKLTATEFKLLAYLAANAGRVLTHHGILTQVWGPADADHVEYLRVYIRQLRKKLETDPEQPEYLLNEPGIGYRFMTDE